MATHARQRSFSPATCLTLVAILATGCGAAADRANEDSKSASANFAKDVEVEASDSAATKATSQTSKRMVIRNAELHITLDDPAAAAKRAASIAKERGGFVLDSRTQGDHGAGRRSEMTLRIPASEYEAAFDAFRELGEVERESSSGEDVTEEYVDLQAQLRSQLALEQRITGMLAAAANIDEALRIQNEMTRVRTQIERIEGRARYLQEHAAMSTFALHLASPEQPMPARSSESVGSRIRNAFADAGDMLLAICLGAIRALGAVLPLGAFTFLAFALLRRRKKGSEGERS